jgi:hypothetical protein
MLYKPEHVVDVDTSAIVAVDLNFGDQPDAHDLAVRVLAVEQQLNHALGAPQDQAHVATVVADMGYFDLTELGLLQDAGIRTAIADPVEKRRVDQLSVEEQRARQRAARTTRSPRGTALMRKRGESVERSFVQVLDYGGARRTTLRGWENIRKRYVVQAACANLALLLRTVVGIGTLKQTWAASEEALQALLRLLQALGQRWGGHWWLHRLTHGINERGLAPDRRPLSAQPASA